jgi:hypothetical protein
MEGALGGGDGALSLFRRAHGVAADPVAGRRVHTLPVLGESAHAPSIQHASDFT